MSLEQDLPDEVLAARTEPRVRSRGGGMLMSYFGEITLGVARLVSRGSRPIANPLPTCAQRFFGQAYQNTFRSKDNPNFPPGFRHCSKPLFECGRRAMRSRLRELKADDARQFFGTLAQLTEPALSNGANGCAAQWGSQLLSALIETCLKCVFTPALWPEEGRWTQINRASLQLREPPRSFIVRRQAKLGAPGTAAGKRAARYNRI